MPQKISISQDTRGIATVTLRRPEKGNALDRETLALLRDAFDRLGADEHTRVIVLRGDGKHFCSGADVSGGIRDDEPQRADAAVDAVCERLNTLAKPTVAVVHGACIGAGLGLAAGCDTLLATPDTFFAIPEVRLGFPPAALTPIFMQAFGARFLRRYLLSGERFDAATAYRAGFIHSIHAPAAMDAAVAEVADAFLRAGPSAFANGKALLHRLAAGSANEDLHGLHAHSIASAEAREGLASFKEKRHPGWYLPLGD